MGYCAFMSVCGAVLMFALMGAPAAMPQASDALAAAAKLRDAVVRGDAEAIIGSLHPSGLRVGDAALAYD